MSKETLVDKLEQTSNVSCTGKYGKYNLNTSQQSTDTVQKFNSDLSKVSDLSLSALQKTVTATVYLPVLINLLLLPVLLV